MFSDYLSLSLIFSDYLSLSLLLIHTNMNYKPIRFGHKF